MTKRFCDLCGEPGMDTRDLAIKRGVGAETYLTRFVVELGFRFITHPGGYGGPPDLCKACADTMIKSLITTDPNATETKQAKCEHKKVTAQSIGIAVCNDCGWICHKFDIFGSDKPVWEPPQTP